MIKKISLLAFLICLLFATSSPAIYPVAAQGPDQITVSNITVETDYPASLTFSCQAQSKVNIRDIRLQYRVEQMGFARVISEAIITFTPSASVKATYSLNMMRYGQVPQGVNIDYQWIVRDAAGEKLQTAESRYTVVDNRHTWNTLTEGKVNLYWYGQNQAFGQTLMSEAQTALLTLAGDTGVTPDERVNISVYTSDQDFKSSVLGIPEWSGGVSLSAYNSILLLIRPGSLDYDLSGIAHELTHVIVDQITFNPYNSVPLWLNEGLAVRIQFSQGDLPSQFTKALSSAVQGNKFISVRSLSAPFSAYADKAYLSYAESVSLVTYLIDQYGSAKMGQLLNTFKEGATYDGALKATYGVDMDGLYAQWKAWVTS